MTVADEALVREAAAALALTDDGPIGAVGGQKAVRRVSRDGQTFVLKVVALEFTTDETLKRAEREVQLLADIDNPNVVKVESELVELGSPVHAAAWIEEYLDGDDLEVCSMGLSGHGTTRSHSGFRLPMALPRDTRSR